MPRTDLPRSRHSMNVCRMNDWEGLKESPPVWKTCLVCFMLRLLLPILSDPIFSLQAITAMGFKQPTPIQKACIPVGLLGKDICACAATGTGIKDSDLGGGERRRQEEDVQPTAGV